MKRPRITIQVVHLQGPMKGEIQEFAEEVVSIGRHPNCLLRFPADLTILSRKHAQIVRDGNRFKIVDTSANGTFVNGKRINKEIYIKSGDVLTLAEGGPKLSFLIQMHEDAAADEPVLRPVVPPVPEIQRTPPPVERWEQPSRVAAERPPVQQSQPTKSDAVSPQTVNVPLSFQYGPTLRSFKQLPVTIGKHPSCQLKIEHPAIVDIHAQIFYVQNQYWVKDLTGRNSMRINGQPIGTQAPLAANDILGFSPQGPFFLFLGGGRLAEIEQPSASDTGAAKRQPEPEPDARKNEGERKSVFKRFFS